MKFLLPFSLTAVAAALAACAAPEAITSMRNVDYVVAEPSAVAGSTSVPPLASASALPGAGRIDSVNAVQRDGGSKWHVTLRMDDGSTRAVDTLTDGVMVGKRAYLDADGRLSLLEREPVVAVRTGTPAASAATGSTTEPAAYETRWIAPKSGSGRVESLAVVPNNAGFSSPDGRPILSVWRIGVRMDDGTMQTMDSPSSGLSVGKRVRITNEGNIVGLAD